MILPSIYLLRGPPAAGKTTVLQRLNAGEQKVNILSVDDFLPRSPVDSTLLHDVYKVARQRLIQSIPSGLNVLVIEDVAPRASHVRWWSRRLLEQFTDGFNWGVLTLIAQRSDCISRNMTRNGRISPKSVDSQYDRFDFGLGSIVNNFCDVENAISELRHTCRLYRMPKPEQEPNQFMPHSESRRRQLVARVVRNSPDCTSVGRMLGSPSIRRILRGLSDSDFLLLEGSNARDVLIWLDRRRNDA